MKLNLGEPQFIESAPQGRASPLRRAQVEAWVMAAQHLRHAALKKCRVVSADRLPTGAWPQIVQLPPYDLFIAVSHASGFVCDDFELTDPLFQALAPDAEPAVMRALVAAATLPHMRQWVNYLVRTEQAVEGQSSPVVDALRTGRLMAVAERLGRDATLRARNSGPE